ncbi:hypothetical protein GGI11_003678 [Coemansia sp. RSA 2049]|nr:hypothetical protein GGI11_003678 [Coemansia sp. RSA 2049]
MEEAFVVAIHKTTGITRNEFQEEPASSIPMRRKAIDALLAGAGGPKTSSGAPARKLTGRTKAFERNTVYGRLRLSSLSPSGAAGLEATDPSRPRSTSNHSWTIPAVSTTQRTFSGAAGLARARVARSLELIPSTSRRRAGKPPGPVTHIESDNSSGEEKATAVPNGRQHKPVVRSRVPDEVAMVVASSSRRDQKKPQSTQAAVEEMEALLLGKAVADVQKDSVDAGNGELATEGRTIPPQSAVPAVAAQSRPKQPPPPQSSLVRSADGSGSLKRKIDGFEALYTTPEKQQQRLATLSKPAPRSAVSPLADRRRKTTFHDMHPARSSNLLSEAAAAVAAAPGGNLERRARVIDCLQPRTHKPGVGKEEREEGESKGVDAKSDAAATASPKTPLTSPFFASHRSRARAAEDYAASAGEPHPRQRPTAATAKRKTAGAGGPKAENGRFPQKTVQLSGVQIGKYTKLDTESHTRKVATSLKLTINYVQRCLVVGGIKDGDEHLRVDGADIASIGLATHDDVAVMRVVPTGTMENLFDPQVFDPTSSDEELTLIVMCWRILTKGDALAVARLGSVFNDSGQVSALDRAGHDKYAAELSKPQSIDLISSSDEEEKGKEADEEAAKEGRPRRSADDAKPREETTAYWSSVGVAGGRGQTAGKPSSGGSSKEDVRDSSVKDKAVGDDSNDQWNPQSLLDDKRRIQAAAAGAGDAGRYRLRRKTTAGPMYSVDDSSDSDSDFVKPEMRAFSPEDYSLRFEYPRGGPKAIPVTGADISRLYSGEFLNDTIIEFYLRYIGEGMRKSDPELYEQCFFFNSFFFKKLSQRTKASSVAAGTGGSPAKTPTTNAELDPNRSAAPANPVEAVYKQLKKWTANVELFEKKYIFVPINENLHWYLAIIVNPKEMISKGSIGSAAGGEGGGDDTKTKEAPAEAGGANGQPHEDGERGLAGSSNGGGLDMFFSTYSPRAKGRAVEDSNESEDMQESSTAMEVDKEREEVEVDTDGKEKDAAHPPADQQEQADAAGESQTDGGRRSEPDDFLPSANEVIDLSAVRTPLKATNGRAPFAGAKESVVLISPDRGPRAAESVTVSFMDKVVEIPDGKYMDPRTTPGIIVLDSLGNRHQQTFGLLRNYMQAEAHSRLGVSVGTLAVGKYAKVPLQNNLCDCGVFLLHYVEEFVKDPAGFVAMALGAVSMRGWFASQDMRAKRKRLLALAARLADEHKPPPAPDL